jgi:flagellar basal-body rod protein FlgB
MSDSTNLTIDAVQMALSAASMRQRVISDDIANINSPDHVRMRVDFEQRLSAALEAASGADNAGATSASLLSDARPIMEPAENSGQPPELDDEMVALSANALHYQALARGLSRYLSIAELIASSTKF